MKYRQSGVNEPTSLMPDELHIHQTDVELLRQFVETNDPAAMEAIISRHGPLVMGLCRRVLKNEHDVADAFQATFLILLKKAGTLDQFTSLAGWLYGVAHRVTLKSKARSLWRQKREASGTPMTPIAPVTDDETLNLIHDEICKLPEKFRLPLILCCLEGATRESAAEQLGWSPGSLKGRLERARALLQTRLRNRGVVYSLTALSTVLAQQAVAEVPIALASSTVSTLSLVGVGQQIIGGVISSEVVALTQGVLVAMANAKIKSLGIAVVLSLLMTTATVVTIRNLVTSLQRKTPDPVAAVEIHHPGVNLTLDEEGMAKERSKRHVKFMGLAMHNYLAMYGSFPASASYSKTGQPLLSWRVHVLPFIDQNDLYKQFKLDEPWDSPHNIKLVPQMPDIYAESATARSTGQTHWQVFVGPTMPFMGQKGMRLNQITDGTSTTILVVEAANPVTWSQPEDLSYDPSKPLPKLGSAFKDYFVAGFADGSVRLVPIDLAEDVLRPWLTATGNEPVIDF
ncbi:sigma-70 family RNA polymerase sigma factor [Schlesneria paludicola]|uniref:sigma-70 family RNA polymerase sigma factor n=1 Tax=Schlesneria paludicola TaxID=360056 RepID=UPI001ED90A57|nr:sigma-70 family RNA polymerase sigma factor [Schlesneria paludicola]